MRKILAVAFTEYRQVVFTKSFIFSLIIPVLIYGGMFAFHHFFGDKTDLKDREIVVVDRTGQLMPDLEEAFAERNKSDSVLDGDQQVAPKFILLKREVSENDKEVTIQLSDEVRSGEIFAFSIIGQDYLKVEGGDKDYFYYYSNSPTFNRLPSFLSRSVREIVEEMRFESAELDRKAINRLTSHNSLERFKLAKIDKDGNILDPTEENPIAAFLLPAGIALLIFFSINMTTPVLLNSVIEEKMQRIAEVLLSSLSPFQLMMGKLLGGTGVGLTFSAVYLFSLSFTMQFLESSPHVPDHLFLWFFVFVVLGIMTFGSMLAGVSSACQDLKDSQNFAGSVIMLLLVPLIISMSTLEAPDGALSKTMSFIPPFSVIIMMNRIAIPPSPPTWQILVSLGLNFVFTILMIWASSRVFRIGILSQGKTPTWKELLRWMFTRS